MSTPDLNADEELFFSLATPTTTERDCYVRDGVTSTFVVPGDWVPDGEASQRVQTSATQLLGEPLDVWGNDVEFYVGAAEAYPALYQDVIATLKASTASFVCHVGWTAVAETTGFAPETTYLDMMAQLAMGGVTTTALYWAGNRLADKENQAFMKAATEKLRALMPPGVVRVFVDDMTRPTGSHHQKIWVILGPEGLTGYFGGLDIHTNRVDHQNDQHPLHDVHARVRGPAAERLLSIVLWRLIGADLWNGTVPAPDPTSDTIPSDVASRWVLGAAANREQLSALYERTHAIYKLWNDYRAKHPSTSPSRQVRVRIGQTVGNPQLDPARVPAQEIYEMVTHGVNNAQRFIYIEDQYFWHIPMAKILGDKIQAGEIKQLIIVTNLSEGLAEHPLHTTLALRHLAYHARGHTDKILVFERTGATSRYVHSKMYVFDDVSALVGSANFNNRGYTHDSESAGVWVDRVDSLTHWHAVKSTLARRLRARLWETHLNVRARHLFDGLGASSFWYEVDAYGQTSAGGSPRVKPVSFHGSKWSGWATYQGGAEPEAGVPKLDGVIEGTDWIIDPDNT